MNNKTLSAVLILSALFCNPSCFAQSSRGVWNANSNSSSSGSSASDNSNSSNLNSRNASAVPGSTSAVGATPASPRHRRGYPNIQHIGNTPGLGYTQNGRTSNPTATQYAAPRTTPQSTNQYYGARNSNTYTNQNQVRQATSSNRGKLLDYNESLAGRTYTVHLPQSYNPATPTPVVIVFHGLGMSGLSVRGLSAMDFCAERNGFITVYPDGVGGRWNDGLQPRGGADDVAFVSDMLDAMSRKYKIDNRRIYACGISNGGFFVQRLACDLSNRIAAIGVVAASGVEAVCKTCSTHRGMPVVFFMGTDDPLLPREGESKELGKLGETLGLADMGIKNMSSTVAKMGGMLTCDEAAEFWARNNNCSAHPRVENLADRDSRDGCKVRRETFSGSNEVVVYTIEGGGHSWPGGMGGVAQDIIGRTCNDINASEIMWQFFQSHSR